MYKILNSRGLGVSGRQNELIELALTHKFDGVEVDIVDLVGRHDALGKEFACQFLQSAKIDMGTFCLPAKISGSQEEFEASIEKLDTIIDLATTLNAKQCYVTIKPTSGELSFQENFETQQSRLQEIGEKLEPHGIKLGIALQASGIQEVDGEFKFVQTAEELATLAKTGQSNVGICLDCWEWVVGGGTLEQLKAIDVSSITEIRLGDVPADADLSTVTKNDRTKLPAAVDGSFSFAAARQLVEDGYDGPISIATSLSTFTEEARDNVVANLSKQLDMIIAGEDPAAVAAAAAAEIAAAEAEAAGEGEEADAAAEAKPAKEAPAKDAPAKDAPGETDAKAAVAAGTDS